ncbi:terminase [Photorhabdus laumondii subsp. laumondii]|uniref:Terminase n=1 Tax=Photorhabdus laumondii subsp. laumondii TaxID=141679 RepID=A0A6L9JNM3_PHOLM|nr:MULTISPECIES: phage terminase small subunit [Photorhabdus]AXG42664.1 terminase [Photorhabdus laumondii subsp. laumondii]MCC8384744.1 terminase [Photorhabdus laumondii]MCC8413481.1 terminase [Photorhabdus laumondii]NDK96473.1 terminase [Photorhabdus laumondii subsp. laumondii]NDL17954.1 terminase [Photorhabdus laumondii subsp. laumondii]
MLTPAQRHFQNVMAQRRGTQTETGDFTAYEQMLYRLRLDKVKLENIQSKAAKAAVKQSLITSYQGWIDGVLSADTGLADDVITTLMIWNVDAGNIDEALRIAEYALRHKLSMPDEYKRTTATALVDEICDPVLVAFNRDPRVTPIDVSLLLRLDAMTTEEDMPDLVRAKLFKAIGYSLRLDERTLESALAYLQQAITLFGNIGVKRDIELLQRTIKNAESKESTISALADIASDDVSVKENTPARKPRLTGKNKTKTNAKIKTRTGKTTA